MTYFGAVIDRPYSKGGTMVDRRQFLKGVTAALVLPSISQQSSGGGTKLTDSLSLITGVGTNVLALITRDGIVLVDSGAPEYGRELLAVTSRVRTVFNTHYHLENTGSNEAFAQAGAKILAHESTREWMATQ